MRESEIKDLMSWDQRLIGIETENLLTKFNGEPIEQEDIQKLWHVFLGNGWEGKPDYYTNVYTDLFKSGPNGKTYNIGNDTGVGIFEMSLPPCRNLHEAKAELLEILDESLRHIKDQKMRLLGYGIQPGTIDNPIEHKTKKSLYATIKFLNLHNLIVGTAASQCGVSLRLNEVVEVTNELNKLSGLVTALFANSPITDKKVYPWKDMRMISWDLLGVTTIPSFENIFGFPKKEFSSIADMLKYLWESPPFGVISFRRDTGWAILDEKINYAEYFRGKEWMAKDLFGKAIKLVPEVKDLNLALIAFWSNTKPHLTLDPKKISVGEFMAHYKDDTLEEYLKDKLINCYVEYRVAASAPKGEEMVFSALTLGLLNNLEEIKKITAQYTFQEWRVLHEQAMHAGMDVKLKDENIYSFVNKLVDISSAGLKKRGLGEEEYLRPLSKRLNDKKCPADYAIEKFNEEGFEKFLNYVSY